MSQISRKLIVLVLVCFFIISISAKVIKIKVGGKGPTNLKFHPQNVTAVKGDIIKWRFAGGNHDVVQSEGIASCDTKKEGGFQSLTNPPEKEFTYTIVNDQEVITYMCMVGNHCISGMWGIIYVGGTEPTPIINNKHKKAGHGHHHKHFSRGQIAGIAIGSSLGLILFSALGFFGYRRYKSKQISTKTAPAPSEILKSAGTEKLMKNPDV